MSAVCKFLRWVREIYATPHEWLTEESFRDAYGEPEAVDKGAI